MTIQLQQSLPIQPRAIDILPTLSPNSGKYCFVRLEVDKSDNQDVGAEEAMSAEKLDEMYSEAVGRDLTISISTGRFSAPKFKHNVAKKKNRFGRREVRGIGHQQGRQVARVGGLELPPGGDRRRVRSLVRMLRGDCLGLHVLRAHSLN